MKTDMEFCSVPVEKFKLSYFNRLTQKKYLMQMYVSTLWYFEISKPNDNLIS